MRLFATMLLISVTGSISSNSPVRSTRIFSVPTAITSLVLVYNGGISMPVIRRLKKEPALVTGTGRPAIWAIRGRPDACDRK